MAELKTKVNDASVAAFLAAIPDAQVREDSRTIVGIMEAATKAKGRMWGTNIVGFGEYRYVYASGREGDWMLIGFAPRKQQITIYIMDGLARYEELLAKLGKHACKGSCLHIKRLSDVHLPTLKKLVRASVESKVKSGSAAARKRSKKR